MSSDVGPVVSALAINVTIPEELRWSDVRRGEEFMLTTCGPPIAVWADQLTRE